MNLDFAPIDDDATAQFSSRDEARRYIVEYITGTGAFSLAYFDIDAICEALIEWHTCYVMRDGEMVEWLPGNGFVIREFRTDVDFGRHDAFWDFVSDHATR